MWLHSPENLEFWPFLVVVWLSMAEKCTNIFFFFFLMQHNYLHYNTKKIQYSAATINTTYNGVLTRLRYKYVYHLQYIGIFTIRF